MVWVINSNSNTCRIYQYNKPTSKLDLINEISHPDLKAKVSEMVSDKPGKYKASKSARGAYSPPSDPKEVKIDNFLHEIADLINQERFKNAFNKLILIAPPQVEGILMLHMDKHVKEMIICSIQKDLIHLNQKDLLEVLDDTPNY